MSTAKKQKPQSVIRWNAIIPFLIVSLLAYLYFLFFFDLHMKKTIEWVGYKALGSELNIGKFQSSFVKGNVQITKIELTNSEKPDFNSIELGDIRFDIKWDALLRVKFVVEEVAVEGVQFMSKRANPGKVAPAETASDKPSFTKQLEEKAINKLEGENQNNILGDTAQFLKTGNFEAQLKSLDSQLLSKKLLTEMNAKWAVKQIAWSAKMKTLPTGQELNDLKEKLGKVKTKDFTSLQELDASVKEAQSIMGEMDTKSKQVQELKTQLDTDLKSIDTDYKSIDKQIKDDTNKLKAHLKIPKIDAASFAKTLFMSYLTPFTKKLDTYKALAEKYLPPKYASMVAGEKAKAEVDNSIQPHPRTAGVTYEFPVKNGYPLFWIQKVLVSSKSNKMADYGDFTGLISNITSNQNQIGRPTTIKFEGDFNKLSFKGIKLDALLNNMEKESLIEFNFVVGSYPLRNLQLLQSKSGSISIPATDSKLTAEAKVVGLKEFDIKLNNTFNDVKFIISSEDKTIDEILKSSLGSISKFDLQASAKGELQNLVIDIRSSLAGDLEKSFQALLQNKINEANAQLQKSINLEVDKARAQLTSQVDSIKNQTQGELKKIQAQIDEQKSLGETKIAQAKKDTEDQAKKKVQGDAQKQLDDVKKKLGL